MQIKCDEIEWQWFSHAAYYDQTAFSQGMNHATGSVPAQQDWVTRAACERAGCQYHFYLSESHRQPCVFGTVAFVQFFLVTSSVASTDLNLHHPYTFT